MLMSVFFDYRIMIRNEKIEVSREKKLAHGSEVSFAINLVKISKTPISNSNFKNSNRVSRVNYFKKIVIFLLYVP